MRIVEALYESARRQRAGQHPAVSETCSADVATADLATRREKAEAGESAECEPLTARRRRSGRLRATLAV